MRVVTTVLIVDDHPSFRAVARRLLETEGYEVVGEAVDGSAALEAAMRLRPDVILLDVQLPDLDGLQVATELSSRPDPPRVILVSSRDASDYGPAIDESGARGFVQKGDLSGELIAALLD